MATISPVNQSSAFAADPANVNSINGSGSLALVTEYLDVSDANPPIYTLTAAAGAIGDETLDLTAETGEVVALYDGMILDVNGAEVIVAQTIKVTDTTTTVAVQPLVAAVTASDTAEIYSVFVVEGIDDLPLGFSSESEDRSDIQSSLQKSSVVNGIMSELSISAFVTPDNEGLNRVVQNAALTGLPIYSFLDGNADGLALYGQVIVTGGFDISGAVNALRKVTTTFSFQPDFAFVPPSVAINASSPEQFTQQNAVRKLFGLREIPPAP